MFVHAVALSYVACAVFAAPSPLRFNDNERNNRGMTWSNFQPGGGVTFWSSATDDFWGPDSEQQHRLLPPNADFDFQNHEADRWPALDSDRDGLLKPPPASPSPAGNSVAGGESEQQPPVNHDNGNTNARPFDDDRERRPLKPSRGSWPNKKGHFNGNDDEDRKYSGANASVNAWFPIMLGMMPPEGKARSDENDSSNDSTNADEPPRSITVVANSVNHASRGRANAHSVLFAGSDPSSSFRRFGRSMIFVR